jgi:hypothetical protein
MMATSTVPFRDRGKSRTALAMAGCGESSPELAKLALETMTHQIEGTEREGNKATLPRPLVRPGKNPSGTRHGRRRVYSSAHIEDGPSGHET